MFSPNGSVITVPPPVAPVKGRFRVITPFEISHFQPRVERCESPARLSELLNDYKQLEAESRATLDKMHNDKIDRVHDILALKRNSTTNSFVAKSAETNAA